MSLIDGIYWQNVYDADKPKEKIPETNYQERVATVKLNESCTPVPTRICLICDKLEYEAATALISASAWICPECKQKIGQMIGVRTDG